VRRGALVAWPPVMRSTSLVVSCVLAACTSTSRSPDDLAGLIRGTPDGVSTISCTLGDLGPDRTLDDALHDQQLCDEWQPVVAACGDFTFVIGHGVDTGLSLYYQDEQLVAIVQYVDVLPSTCDARSTTIDVPMCSGGNTIPMPLCSSKH
jgi:hypothetical protein